MIGLKSYFLKIAILLIAIGSMAFLYWTGYHKSFDEKCIPQNADGIIMVDVKNTRNHFVFSYLKNPSEWQRDTTETEFEKLFDLSDFGLKTPDYFALFHIKDQPSTQWFITLEIENETVFENAVTKSHFRKTTLQNGMNSYLSDSKALIIIKHSNQILVSNVSEKKKKIAVNIAEDLFFKKLFLDSKTIEKTIGTDNAVTFWIKKNSLLEKDGILNLKLDDHEITIDGQLHLKPKYRKEWRFSQNPNALLSFGIDIGIVQNQSLLKIHSDKINKMIGFDLDSILVHHPTKTELVLNGIIEKKDTAISYDYDDDFNPIKKVVVHTRREPSFYFSLQTENSKKAFNYLKNQNAIDQHNTFVNFPLAKTKTLIRNNTLTFEANYLKNSDKLSDPKIGYLQIHFNKLSPEDWRFMIAKNKNSIFLKTFETFEINLSKENSTGHFRACLKTRDEKNLISVIK